MNIQCKSCIDKLQMKDRYAKGFRLCEIQMLSSSDCGMDEILDKLPDMDYLTVHSPLKSIIYSEDEQQYRYLANTNIDNASAEYQRKNLNAAFELAQKIAEVKKHNVGVVVHIETNLDKLLDTGAFYEMTSYLSDALYKYSDTYLCIENVSPIDRDGALKNGLRVKDVCQVIYALRKHLPEYANRIGMCFDICHWQIAMRTLTVLSGCFTNSDLMIEDLDTVLTSYSDCIWNVHFNYAFGFGDTGYTHSQGFPDSKVEELKKYISIFNSWENPPIITLECNENDYFDVKQQPHQRDLIESVLRVES